MNRFAASLFALLVCLCVTSCGGGDTHEEAAKDALGVMHEFADILADITDKESAEANKAKLEGLVSRMQTLDERMKALGDPTEEQAKAMEELPGVGEAREKLLQEMMRLSTQPEAMVVIQSTMEKMPLGN